MDPWIPSPRQLPLIVVALIVPTFLGFAVGGVAVGTVVGATTIAALIVIAARSRPQHAIEFDGDPAGHPVLVLALAPIDDTASAQAITALAESGSSDRDPSAHAVLVLAPARSAMLQRWLSDTDEARVGAQQNLALSLATLAAAGCHAEGRVVDADPVQAIEDVAAQYGAERVAVVVSGPEHDREIEELERRIDRPLHRIAAGS